MFDIEYARGVIADLRELRTFDRTRLLDRIEDQLAHQPTSETKKQEDYRRIGPAVGA